MPAVIECLLIVGQSRLIHIIAERRRFLEATAITTGSGFAGSGKGIA